MNMSAGTSSHEAEARAVIPSAAPRAAGIEAVIQQAVEHVTAFSASLEQRRAEAQLEQALAVCQPTKPCCTSSEARAMSWRSTLMLQSAAGRQRGFCTGEN